MRKLKIYNLKSPIKRPLQGNTDLTLPIQFKTVLARKWKPVPLKIMKREITVTQTKEQRSKRNRSVTHNNNTYDVTVSKKEQRINFSTCNQYYNCKQTLIPTLVGKKKVCLTLTLPPIYSKHVRSQGTPLSVQF